MRNKKNSRNVMTFLALSIFLFAGEYSFAFADDFDIGSNEKVERSIETKFDHGEYDLLLKKYVDDEGLVNYAGFSKDRSKLDKYLAKIGKTNPNKFKSKDEKNAFYINAYNAYTIRAVLDDVYLKTTSVKKVKGFWTRKVNLMGGKKYSLNKIEKLSRKLKDPRMHFAVNCASLGCPRLQRFAYDGAKLQEQFDFITKDFLSDMERGLRIDRDKNKVGISKIFSWYAGDFSGNTSSFGFYTGFIKSKFTKSSGIKFIVENVEMDVADYLKSGKPDIEYLDYDWGLNKQSNSEDGAD